MGSFIYNIVIHDNTTMVENLLNKTIVSLSAEFFTLNVSRDKNHRVRVTISNIFDMDKSSMKKVVDKTCVTCRPKKVFSCFTFDTKSTTFEEYKDNKYAAIYH